MKNSTVLRILAMLIVATTIRIHAAESPNIVYFLCDDLGYGDVHCLNPERGKIPTPNLDQFAREGMIFTDAHSGSSVCTPTRYGILTGRYSWRTSLQRGVLGGFSEPLIALGRWTVPALLRQNGYATACIGKWHLGMNFAKLENPPRKGPGWAIDYTAPIKQGPVACGFDTYFGITASLDMPPYVFIKDDRFTEVPTTTKKYIREGPAAESFEAVNVLPTLVRKSVEFIREHAGKSKPFFLYLPVNSPHTPIVPTPEWKGKSGLGDYGDFVMETDWAFGEVLKALDASGIRSNTWVVFTSDNGCSPAAGVTNLEAQGHFPSASFRGYKSDIWDGGHRIPFITRWPGHIPAGSRCGQIICLTDLMATCADIVGFSLPDNAGGDSVSLLPALNGKIDKPLRDMVVHHSIQGRFALRSGSWKLAFCPGSGGWSQPTDKAAAAKGITDVQLYDMNNGANEQTNVVNDHPEVVASLTQRLKQIIANGRSTPGPVQTNDVPVQFSKEPLNGPFKAE